MGKARYNILLAGVGGQGLLTLGAVIGNAVMDAGLDVTIAETHGLSQRGGSLAVHVRIGEEPSPLIPSGGADMIIGLEALETARYITYASKNTIIAMNRFLWPPPLAEAPDLDTIIREVSSRAKLYTIDANSIAIRETGTVITANMVMLGFAIAVSHGFNNIITMDNAMKALETVFRGKALELNKKALESGYREGLSIVEKG